MAFASDTSTGASGLRDLLSNALGGLSQRFARYRVYRKTLLELSSLSNRELADLGLNRSTIRAVAYEAAYDNQL